MINKDFRLPKVKTGSYGKLVSSSVPKIIKQLADDGHNIIVDEVIWEREDLEKYLMSLKSHKVYFIKVDCELSLMEEREMLRGDCSLGLARGQHTKMKNLDWKYNFQVDSTYVSPFSNAKKILEFIKNN